MNKINKKGTYLLINEDGKIVPGTIE